MRAVVTGAAGLLGSAVLAEFGESAVAAVRDRRQGLGDLSDRREVARLLTPVPDIVIHCAALASITACAADPAQAYQANVIAVRNLVEECGNRGSRLVLISSDQVFGAGSEHGMGESDDADPMTVYGETKLAAEQTAAALEGTLIVRLPVLYAEESSPRATFVTKVVAALRAGERLQLDGHRARYPTSTKEVATLIQLLVARGTGGVVHISAPEQLTDVRWAETIAQALQLQPDISPWNPPVALPEIKLRTDRLVQLGFRMPLDWTSALSRRLPALS